MGPAPCVPHAGALAKPRVRRPELADIVRAHGAAYRAAHALPAAHLKILRAVERCRTAELGGHIDRCDSCGLERPSYNSCRNRHCPKCQAAASARWVAERASEILPVGYFHLVFTLPHELNPLILTNKAPLLGLLFEAVADTLGEFGRNNLGGQLGVTTVLHTWDQKLGDHFHLHCLVAAGALTRRGWRHTPRGFLFPTAALGKVFRAKYLAGLKALHGKLKWVGRSAYLQDVQAFSFFEGVLRAKKWVVYAKAPFGRPETVVAYLGRYTHRVALSNRRIVRADEASVTFLYRDRQRGDTVRPMVLTADEFLRRFLLHELPKGFVRIRHYGFLANRGKESALARCREALGDAQPRPLQTAEPVDRTRCPQCPGNLVVSRVILAPWQRALPNRRDTS